MGTYTVTGQSPARKGHYYQFPSRDSRVYSKCVCVCLNPSIKLYFFFPGSDFFQRRVTLFFAAARPIMWECMLEVLEPFTYWWTFDLVLIFSFSICCCSEYLAHLSLCVCVSGFVGYILRNGILGAKDVHMSMCRYCQISLHRVSPMLPHIFLSVMYGISVSWKPCLHGTLSRLLDIFQYER